MAPDQDRIPNEVWESLAAFGQSLATALAGWVEAATQVPPELGGRERWRYLIPDRRLLLKGRDPAALERLTDCFESLPLRLGPRARRALAERASEIGWSAAKREALMAGVFAALAERDGLEQRIRFGRTYIGDENGHPARLTPGRLSVEGYIRWLRKEVAAGAEAFLLDGFEDPPMRSVATHDDCFGYEYTEHLRCGRCERLEECGEMWAAREARTAWRGGADADEALLLSSLAEGHADPAELLLAAEEDKDERFRLAAERGLVGLTATPRQRELLGAMRRAPSIEAAAALCGMDPSTARVQIGRLRRRLSAM